MNKKGYPGMKFEIDKDGNVWGRFAKLPLRDSFLIWLDYTILWRFRKADKNE